MTPRNVTELVLLLTVAGLVLFNVYMTRTYGPTASISHVIGKPQTEEEFKRTVVLAVALGFIMGHWFWGL